MTKRKRSVLLAVIITVLCISMVAAGTYALFTDDADVTTHLKAGNLDLTLSRINLDKWCIDPLTGDFVNRRNSDPVVFSDETNKNVFDMSDKELVVPLSSYTATMRIENNGNVAFTYWIEIVLNEDADKELSEQLYITVVKADGGVVDGYLKDVEKQIGSQESPLSTVYIKNDDNQDQKYYEDFKVSIEFRDSEATDNDLLDGANNNAMNQSVKVDLIVHAVQVLPKTEQSTETPTTP